MLRLNCIGSKGKTGLSSPILASFCPIPHPSPTVKGWYHARSNEKWYLWYIFITHVSMWCVPPSLGRPLYLVRLNPVNINIQILIQSDEWFSPFSLSEPLVERRAFERRAKREIQKLSAWASAIQGKKLSGERIANLEKMSECPALKITTCIQGRKNCQDSSSWSHPPCETEPCNKNSKILMDV